MMSGMLIYKQAAQKNGFTDETGCAPVSQLGHAGSDESVQITEPEMIKTLTYAVEQTIAFEVPSDVVQNCVRNAFDDNGQRGQWKISAIKSLRTWFTQNHHRPLGLLDAKNLVEMEAENVAEAANG